MLLLIPCVSIFFFQKEEKERESARELVEDGESFSSTSVQPLPFAFFFLLVNDNGSI